MAYRLNKVTREFNVGNSTIVEFLAKKGHKIDSDPNTKISDEEYQLLVNEFNSEKKVASESKNLNMADVRKKKETISLDEVEQVSQESDDDDDSVQVTESPDLAIKVVGKIDLGSINSKTRPDKKPYTPEPKKSEVKAPVKPVVETPVKKEEKVIEKPVEKPVAKIQEQPKPEPVVEKVEKQVVEEELYTPDRTPIDSTVKVIGRIDLNLLNQKTRPDKKSKEERDQERKDRKYKGRPEPEPAKAAQPNTVKPEERGNRDPRFENRDRNTRNDVYKAPVDRLSGPTIVGKIDLQANSDNSSSHHKGKRARIKKDLVKVDDKKIETTPASTSDKDKKKVFTKGGGNNNNNNKGKKFEKREEVSDKDVQKQIKETFNTLYGKEKSKAIKYRREKRDAARQGVIDDAERQEEDKMIIKVTEFISVSDLSKMMEVPVNEIISTCMSLGMFVSINQRLDAETIALISEEFGYGVEFVTVEIQEAIQEEEDTEDKLKPRPPIVTVMGHVDHGKTSLLDHIRRTNVIAGEAGGITQHIGAYSVKLDEERSITFLDTPGHEAFTAMRARGAQVTDVAIIVVAADDNVMPQTIEAINHASAAGVPIVFAINKIDKEGANIDNIKQQLAAMNYLVEDWGGKYQSQEISAKKGISVDKLLEKVLLEAEMLTLLANPDKRAKGTVIESELDKGRGYISTLLLEGGTLKVGDIMLAGQYTGRIKAMYNERNQRVQKVGPGEPVIVLGLNGAPQAGDKFNVMPSEKEAKEIASKREQLMREQAMRTNKHITLDEIGRRIAIGNFKQLNIIVKGDVDGSVEALADSLIKLSNEEIIVKVIHKAVGPVTESDVMLASASDAIIIGFQVRPSVSARKLAEKEGIDIRPYSIIYDAINDVRDAMIGMLSPEIKEEITATIEIREVFKITKVGTVAGCFVTDGKIDRKNKVRIIRDGIVIYSGDLGSLKRFKDDVKEVARGFECGLNIDKFNDIKEGDIIEAYSLKEVQRKKLN
jgi:translation initiation factor IF-2